MRPAELEARKLRTSLGLKSPLNVESIAQHLELEILRQPLDEDVSAMLVLGERRSWIVVNEQHSLTRQRFSIAHELGHYILHRHSNDLFVDGSFTFYRDRKSADGTSIVEVQANAFAAELLMPEDEIKNLAAHRHFDIYDEDLLRKYAAKFGVSPQALAVRLVHLGLSM